MQMLPTFLTNGLLAGLVFHYVILFRKDKQKHCALIYNLKSKSNSSKFYEMTSFNTWLGLLDSDVLLKNWKDSEISVLPIYKELIAAGLKIWVFRYGFKSFLYSKHN